VGATLTVNRTYLSKLDKGASYPRLEIIAKLATVTKVQAAELLAIPTEPPSPALPTIVV
jgi:transcriptional regulator with XRE-family HTH domain